MKKHNPLNDDFSEVTLVAHSDFVGDNRNIDFMPVYSARVSYGADNKAEDNEANDIKLMNFLAKHKHMTPFEHQYVTFRVVCPLFVAREWMRHRTQSYNEFSMRYSGDMVGQLYMPEVWRTPHKTNKQSSEGHLDPELTKIATSALEKGYREAIKCYNILMDMGVAKELARLLVPVGNYTKFYVSSNLRNWAHFCGLRLSEDAQYEIRVYAQAIDDILEELYPHSWGVLKNNLNV